MSVYEKLSPWVPEPWSGPVWAGYFSATALAGGRYRVTRWEGKLKGSGERGRVVTAARSGWMGPYWREVFFDGEVREDDLGGCTVYGLGGRLRELGEEADVCIGLTGRYLAGWVAGEEMLRMPAWVGHRLAMPGDEAGRRRVLAGVGGDRHTVKKAGFTWELGGDVEAFHGRYYVPTVEGRHGAGSAVVGVERMRREVREGARILWIYDGERRVGGALVPRRGKGLVLRAVGVEGGETELLRRGVMAACYLFLFEAAGEMGYEWIDYRGTRPGQADGVFRFKQKWGAEVYDSAGVGAEEMVAYWGRPSAAVDWFLAGYGPVFRWEGGLGVAAGGKWRVPAGVVEVAGLREASGVRRGRGGSGR